jgi:hypothetical protein
MFSGGDMQNSTDKELMINGLKGAIAGAIGVWVMDRVDWFNFEHEDPAARRQTERVRPDGLDPSHVAASKVAEATGTQLSAAQHNAAGMGIHYALGIGPGALYGALRERLPVSTPAQDYIYGAGMGLTLFLVQDEGLNAAMGLSADQRKYPWQAHARGLVAHLVLGVVTNAVLNLLKAPRPSPRAPKANNTRVTEEDFDATGNGLAQSKTLGEDRMSLH